MKLSIIVVGRNDDYCNSEGGSYLNRVELFLKSLNISLADISYEVLFFDFKPPREKLFLSEVIENKDNVEFIIFSEDKYNEYVHSCYDNGGKFVYSSGNFVMSCKHICFWQLF